MKQEKEASTGYPSGTRPPEYVVVIDQRRDRTWSGGISLAEALELGHSHAPEPEADREAEP